MKKICLVSFALLCLILAEAQTPSPYVLKIRSGLKTPVPNIDATQWPRFLEQQPLLLGKRVCLLQFESTPNDTQIKELFALGIVLDEYVDALAYRASIIGMPGWEKLKSLGLRSAFLLEAIPAADISFCTLSSIIIMLNKKNLYTFVFIQ